MKAFSFAVAVAVVLTFICFQKSFAVPVIEVQEFEEPFIVDVQGVAPEDPSGDMLQTIFHKRQKRAMYCGRCCDSNGTCTRCCYA
ncbi:hepcidin-like isoform X2 [Cololabis saira]|uniref:hepcidin-like isoform X2 n=1 Tax=Cololabis saira TaxID=129043 RepID=UPI002AD4C87C|nr:hepcidin-like isoform X2 [Cololabis saira]